MHAWQQEGIEGPDIQTVGKSLGGGFIPLSAVLVHQHIFDVVANVSGSLAGGHTFQVNVSKPNNFAPLSLLGPSCGLCFCTSCTKDSVPR